MTLREALDFSNIALYQRYITDEYPAAFRAIDQQHYLVEGMRESPLTIKSPADGGPIKSPLTYALQVFRSAIPTEHIICDNIEEVELFLLFEYFVRVDEGWQPVMPPPKRSGEFG